MGLRAPFLPIEYLPKNTINIIKQILGVIMSVTKVNGGITSKQSLAGSLKYFKMTGAFAYAVSDGSVTIGNPVNGGSTNVTYYTLIKNGDGVPGSLADLAIRALSEKCNIVEIGLVGAPGAETAIHFSASGSSFGWIDNTGAIDVVGMKAAITNLGATIVAPTTSGSPNNPSATPVTASVSTNVTITNVPFKLA